MMIIDAETGHEVRVGGIMKRDRRIFDTEKGCYVEDEHKGEYDWELVKVEDRLFSARARIRYLKSGRTVWLPLIVRFTHPGFFLQRVAFIPS